MLKSPPRLSDEEIDEIVDISLKMTPTNHIKPIIMLIDENNLYQTVESGYPTYQSSRCPESLIEEVYAHTKEKRYDMIIGVDTSEVIVLE